MWNAPNQSETLVIRIHRNDIAFVKFLFESYEGLASVTTVENVQAQALVGIRFAPGCRHEVDAVLNDLMPDIYTERVDSPLPPVLSATARLTT